jgi:hypothetical protein
LLRATLWPFASALLTVLLVVGVPLSYAGRVEPHGIRPWPLPPMDSTILLTVLGIVASAATAVLALMYTAIGVVISARYATVPANVYQLVAKDPIHNRYLRLLAHLAAVALMLLGLVAFGVPVTGLAMGYVMLVAVVSVLGFIPIGFHAFAYFTPAHLARFPIREFNRAVGMATATTWQGTDESFQNHANKNTTEALHNLDDLMQIALAESQPRNNPSLVIARSMLNMLMAYAGRKHAIPTGSRWFAVRPEFVQWDTQSGMHANLLLQTGTTPAPSLVPDPTFVEERIADATDQALGHMLSIPALDDAAALLFRVHQTTEVLCNFHLRAEAVLLLDRLRPLLVERIAGSLDKSHTTAALQATDLFCVAALAPVLDAPKAIADPSMEDMLAIAEAVHRLDRNGVYAGPASRRFGRRRMHATTIPRRVTKAAEDLLDRLIFERQVEGRVLTPLWFVRQEMARAWAIAARATVQDAPGTIERQFLVPATYLVDAGASVSAAAWLERAIEACKKAKSGTEALVIREAELREHFKAGEPWPPLDATPTQEKIAALRSRVVREMARNLPGLLAAPKPEDRPDAAGPARAFIADELVSMMERQEIDGFSGLFQAYLDAALFASGQHIDPLAADMPPLLTAAQRGVLLHAMDLSGMAFLYSELDGTPYADVICAAWDQWLDPMALSVKMIDRLYGVIDQQMLMSGYTANSSQSFDWPRQFGHRLRERGFHTDEADYEFVGDEPPPMHPSDVIESVSMIYGVPFEQPHAYFGGLYLGKRPGAESLRLPDSVVDCLRRIKQARDRRTEQDGPPDGEPNDG